MQTQVKFHHQFHFTVLSSVSYEVQQLFLTFGVARNDLFRRYLKQPYRSLQYDVYNIGTRFLSTCYSNFWWIPS